MKVTVLKKEMSPIIEKLFLIHKTDKLKSRVLIKNDPDRYTYKELLMFEEGDNITLMSKRVRINISINNKMYFVVSEKICYIYKDGRFWYTSKKGTNNEIKPLLFNHFSFCNYGKDIKEYFISKFSWLKFIQDDSLLHTTPFNVVTKNKLYNSNDLYKHLYKTNLPSANLFKEKDIHYSKYKIWIKHCINLGDNMNSELLSFDNKNLFEDSIRMADTLNVKVNCKWSVKRLKQEHDNWAKIITDIVLTETDRPLNINKIYLDFAEQNSDITLIKSTKELVLEGKKLSHCVASYTNSVDSGYCAIFHYNGYTAQISKIQSDLKLTQFKGFGNCNPPDDLADILTQKLDIFNKSYTIEEELITQEKSIFPF